MMAAELRETRVVILGAGGLAREVYWVFREANKTSGGRWKLLGFVDEDPAKLGKDICDKRVLGGLEWLEKAPRDNLRVISAVGSPRIRKALIEKATRLGLEFCTVIHPNVQSSEYVDIGLGTVITAGCILTTQIRIADHIFLNLDTTVGHDVVIENFVNVAPGCHISGNVVLREGADLGTGAVVLQGVAIGRWSVVGAGAVVIADVPDNAVVVGVPAKVIRYQQQKDD